MNYSLSSSNNNQFQDFNKFSKTANDVFGVGKDLFGAYNGGGGYGGIIAGGIRGLGEGLRHGSNWHEDVPQAIFGIDDEKDSDVMQTIKGATKGAVMGAPFGGPIGMIVGALLGAGASFLDDI